MVRIAPCILILAFFCTSASAWGNATHKYFCESAVRELWGNETYEKCFVDASPEDFCAILGGDAYDDCLKNPTWPWIMPEHLFGDFDMQEDYSQCPVTGHPDARWICGDPEDDFASSTAETWFEKAKESSDICARVYDFCIGSHYFTSSMFPLNQVMHEDSSCQMELEKEVDGYIANNSGEWSARKQCSFIYFEPKAGQSVRVRHSHTFLVNDAEIQEILSNLTEKGRTIYRLPLGRTELEELIIVSTLNLTEENLSEEIIENVTRELNETLEGVYRTLAEISGMTGKDIKERKGPGVMAIFIALLIAFGVGLVLYVHLRVGVKKEKIIKRPTPLVKMEGVDGSIEEKLINAGITNLHDFMSTKTKKLAKKSGIPEEKISGLKRNQLDAVDNYFLLDSRLTPEDLTVEQMDEIIRMKSEINKTMSIYRDMKKPTDEEWDELNALLEPLNDNEKREVWRLIKGEVDIHDDYPYRIIITSAEGGASKIAEIHSSRYFARE